MRFKAFTSTRELYLPGGDAPAVGSMFKNHDLADTYDLIAEKGTETSSTRPARQEIVSAVQKPAEDLGHHAPRAPSGT